VLRALEAITDGRSVSVPKVLVNNNQQGLLNSVNQQPITTTITSNTSTQTSFAGTADAGTIVTVKPSIAAGDHLVLEYNVEISAFVGESTAEGIPPPSVENSLQSVVSIPDGHTVVVGGLEIETEGESVSQVPFLGSIPLIGELFKNRSKSASRTRFFAFIKPTILRHERFEDLKYLTVAAADEANVDTSEDWPTVEPRLIR